MKPKKTQVIDISHSDSDTDAVSSSDGEETESVS